MMFAPMPTAKPSAAHSMRRSKADKPRSKSARVAKWGNVASIVANRSLSVRPCVSVTIIKTS